MAITIGQQLGSYEITGLLGKGGMGEVYRARDTKLKRDVAIKIMPDEFMRDDDRVSRFHREAELLASLNHPNIGAIYDLQQEGNDTRFLVLELVEGDTLADRIAHGPLALQVALQIATQIADALEAAHGKGIVHRDLKPANIRVTPEGKVKVLDFGLAKVFQPEPAQADSSKSPTLVSGTMTGVILGTAAYMSPEQARGQSTDHRSDVWAFGCVLYEMLTGQRAFDGETITDILGGIVRVEPEWHALPEATPLIIRFLLRRCLEKNRIRRLQNMTEARVAIEDVLSDPSLMSTVGTTSPTKAPAKNRERLVWMAASLILLIGMAVLYLWPRVEQPEMRLQVVTPPAINLCSFAISPDGRTLVFQAAPAGNAQLYTRTLDSEKAQQMSGTENGSLPFWSPDSQSIGFFADGKLKRADIAGGVQRITDAPNSPSGTWNSEGVILFALTGTGPLRRVSAAGGPVMPVTEVNPPKQVSHRFPRFLPDGQHFLYFVVGDRESRGVYVGSLDGKDPKRLFDADSAAAFLPPNQLLFARQSRLFAQPFDVVKLETSGNAVPVAEGLNTSADWLAEPAFSVSQKGIITYRVSKNDNQLVWFDRAGKQIGMIGGPDTALSASMRLSHDERTVSVTRTVSGNTDVWLIELARNVLRRLTFDPADDNNSLWSPDDQQIAFSSRQKLGNLNLYVKSINGSGSDEPLVQSTENKFPLDWSPDGRFLLYNVDSPKTGQDIWAWSFADKKSFAVAETNADESSARFSADGRWIAFISNETGRNEVYIQPFPGPAAKSAPISTNGGLNPHWRADGKEIFYAGLDNRLMSVPVTLRPNGQVESGTPASLFSLRPRSEYEVTRDGQRFLVHAPTEDATSSPITIVLNWARKK